ncbi:N-acetylmuramoyl-L-alanine amidase [Nonomuraea roseola]|uniref:N-acetylmuramoyl-L-alanine amidase n=1 Tax=Nonomuraea roseola TaxID=46179 RepID=A0ABV5PUH3_9ACTN
MLLWAAAVLAASAAGGLQDDARAAAAEYGVPESVLLGVSYLESRWDSHGGRPSVSGGYGPMHLVDAAAVPKGGHHHVGDPRGDGARPMRMTAPLPPARPAEQTLQRAARLTGLPPDVLRRDRAANLRGGAALLADEQRRLGAPLSSNPVAWHGALTRYANAGFANEVFEVLREGAGRRTDDGSLVRLPATPVPSFRTGRSTAAECPSELACEWMPAAYERTGKGDYGNHDRLGSKRRVDYIVIHDTEGTFRGIPTLVKNPKYVSWHYTIRSRDGHVAQHVRTNDVAWHAGNWDVNSRSIGIEHEGYLAKGGTWYTEAMYRSSADLVRYLADKYGVPLDRAHVIGHDNVPGTTAKTVPGMHEDPGPYWDWARFFALMDAPIQGDGEGGGEGEGEGEGTSVIINPDYANHQPTFTGCVSKTSAKLCKPQGAASVWLHTEPRSDAALVDDAGKRPGAGSTFSVYDHSARATAGQRYALAGTSGEWTAIWYLGQKAWFQNPPSSPTAVRANGPLVTPIKDKVKVYGRAYPERSAYPSGVRYQEHAPLPYTLRKGQYYSLAQTLKGSYLAAGSYNPAKHVTVRGKLRYHQIQLGHRVMFVRADDVRVIS